MMFSFSPFTKRLFFVVAFLSVLLSLYLYMAKPEVELMVDMASSVPSQAQLFYDTGTGFVETDSATIPVHSSSLESFENLTFSLPVKSLFNLRFDPLMNPGQVVIRSVAIRNRGKVIEKIAVSKLVPMNQMSIVSAAPDHIEFATAPAANDPQLRIRLDHELNVALLVRKQRVHSLAVVNGSLALAFVILAIIERLLAWRRIPGGVRKINAFVAKIAQRQSGDFMAIDAPAIWTYAGLLIFFLIGVSLNLNGSSEAVISNTYHRGGGARTLVGTPRESRSDEWAYETPAILNQYFRPDRFAVEDSVPGNHFVALASNIPVKHITTLLRPQFWPFFSLRIDYAYAMYWQAKGLILTAGVFTFLLWITGSTAWGLTGALWYFFSAFTQWTYSTPSALPETVGFVCSGTVLFCYLTVAQSGWRHIAAAVGAIVCAVDFAMCAYVPYLIPLAWIAVAMVAAWCVSHPKEIFRREGLWLRSGVILLSLSVAVSIGLNVWLRLKFALTALPATTFLGHRWATGGTMPLWIFGSHFLQWSETENHFPAMLGSLYGESGFLWLAPVTLFCITRLALSRFQKACLGALWTCGLLLLSWDLLPMPVWFGKVSALDLCAGERTLPALGLVNVVVVVLTAATLKPKELLENASAVWRNAIYYLSGFLALYLILAATDGKLGGFFSNLELVTTAASLALICVLMVLGKSRALAVALLIPHIVAFGAVNPVERGLRVYTRSALNRFAQSHRQLLSVKWLVYSNSIVSSGFFSAAGFSVYTGMRYLPDVDHLNLFARSGIDLNVMNQSGYLLSEPIAEPQKSAVSLERTGVIHWKVAANDSILKELGIRYVAFDMKPSPLLATGLVPVTDVAVDGFWMYQILGKDK